MDFKGVKMGFEGTLRGSNMALARMISLCFVLVDGIWRAKTLFLSWKAVNRAMDGSESCIRVQYAWGRLSWRVMLLRLLSEIVVTEKGQGLDRRFTPIKRQP